MRFAKEMIVIGENAERQNTWWLHHNLATQVIIKGTLFKPML